MVGGASMLGGDEAQVTERLTAQLRRQQVLYMPGKNIQLVIGEAALHTTFGDRATLVGQLDRLQQLAGLPNVMVMTARTSARLFEARAARRAGQPPAPTGSAPTDLEKPTDEPIDGRRDGRDGGSPGAVSEPVYSVEERPRCSVGRWCGLRRGRCRGR